MPTTYVWPPEGEWPITIALFLAGLAAGTYSVMGLIHFAGDQRDEPVLRRLGFIPMPIMIVVPRLFELLRARIMKGIEGGGALSSYLLDRALKIGRDRNDHQMKPWDLPMHGLVGTTLRRKVRAKRGRRVKAGGSGGARSGSSTVIRWMNAMGRS